MTQNPDIFYIQSDSKEEDVLLLHGWGGSSESFRAVFEFLQKKYRVTAIDFPGFGKSPSPPYPYTVTDYAQKLKDFLDSKNISKTHIIAHSFGGRVAIELCYRYPELVDKLILTASAGIKPKRKLRYYINLLKFKTAKLLKKDLSKFGSKDYKNADGVMRAVFVKAVNYDQTKLLKHIKANTLLVWGQNDTETPIYMAKKINRLIKNSKLIVFRDTGHFAYMEKSLLFLRHIQRFLGGCVND